ncbi:MEMBRANE-ASSOCIATED KINASE REGULATOR 4-RELATED [Salix purpurea]|uniref:MEMBRANE-ASSOCIATED KINASE REGULATOR 4-RELATED n=1 Tax=Salix purpurea TaxID=77065 RepID=A0A9Q0WNW6_SALPP|nr:MEMBRANE-ASSOCIATED KINASE REGULATOR 4-RELATED [Salix purpurea]
MEGNHHKKTSSREYIFSFPSTPSTLDQDSDFEFGCLTPDSPSTDPNKNSPADHLFCNGRLLPHSFPVLQHQPTTMVLIDNIYRANSRASSVSSRDSLMSSRSNSSNSSRSSFSSARTSSSDNSERRRLYNFTSCQAPLASKVVIAQLYGSSQRWQHIMPVPAAALKRVDSRRKSCRVLVKEGQNNNKKQLKKGKRERSGFWRRFFRSFLVACRECHAMESSTKDDILERNIKL